MKSAWEEAPQLKSPWITQLSCITRNNGTLTKNLKSDFAEQISKIFELIFCIVQNVSILS